jgi:hypothetical protein
MFSAFIEFINDFITNNIEIKHAYSNYDRYYEIEHFALRLQIIDKEGRNHGKYGDDGGG